MKKLGVTPVEVKGGWEWSKRDVRLEYINLHITHFVCT